MRLMLIPLTLLLSTACSLTTYPDEERNQKTNPTPPAEDADKDDMDPKGPADDDDDDEEEEDDDIPFFGNQPVFPDAGTVTGRVMAPSGTVPAAGTEVAIDVGTDIVWTLTGTNGAFSLDLPPGTWTANATKGRYTKDATFDITTNITTDVGILPLASDVRIAVIYGKYDSIGVLVDQLGIPYDSFATPNAVLGDPTVLAQYDAVFANCGSVASTVHSAEYTQAEIDNTRDWVTAGGTLYASDWEWELFEGVAPDAIDFGADPNVGSVQYVDADLLDRDIRTMVGSPTARIGFDLDDWAMPVAVGSAYPLVEGPVAGTQVRPLAAIHFLGSGRMIYTAFHNEVQATSDMQLILYEMILSL